MYKYLFIFFALITILFSTCSSIDSTGLTSGVFSYGSNVGQDVQMFVESKIGPQTDSIVVIHGGGWHWGDRKDMASLAESWAKAGFLVYNMNYRLGYWPDYLTLEPKMQDIDSVVELAITRAEASGASGRIHLVGASAGGHLSLQYAYGIGRGKISHVASIFGPTNFTNPFYQNNQLKDVLTKLIAAPLESKSESAYRAASPLFQIKGGEPSSLLIHGDADPLVDYQDSLQLADALKKVSVDYKLITVPGGNHGENWGGTWWETAEKEVALWFMKP